MAACATGRPNPHFLPRSHIHAGSRSQESAGAPQPPAPSQSKKKLKLNSNNTNPAPQPALTGGREPGRQPGACANALAPPKQNIIANKMIAIGRQALCRGQAARAMHPNIGILSSIGGTGNNRMVVKQFLPLDSVGIPARNFHASMSHEMGIFDGAREKMTDWSENRTKDKQDEMYQKHVASLLSKAKFTLVDFKGQLDEMVSGASLCQ
jgi:hypothetical protein